MALTNTYNHMKDLLNQITIDLFKSENGNKAASQRVRTGTVKLEKLAKLFRKESISAEKGEVRKSAKTKAKAAPAAAKSKVAAKGKAAAPVAAPKAKSKTVVSPRPLTVKKATAKLPTKRR